MSPCYEGPGLPSTLHSHDLAFNIPLREVSVKDERFQQTADDKRTHFHTFRDGRTSRVSCSCEKHLLCFFLFSNALHFSSQGEKEAGFGGPSLHARVPHTKRKMQHRGQDTKSKE